MSSINDIFDFVKGFAKISLFFTKRSISIVFTAKTRKVDIKSLKTQSNCFVFLKSGYQFPHSKHFITTPLKRRGYEKADRTTRFFRVSRSAFSIKALERGEVWRGGACSSLYRLHHRGIHLQIFPYIPDIWGRRFAASHEKFPPLHIHSSTLLKKPSCRWRTRGCGRRSG